MALSPVHSEIFYPNGDSIGVPGIGASGGFVRRRQDPKGYVPAVGFPDEKLLQAAIEKATRETPDFQKNSQSLYDMEQGFQGQPFGTPSGQNCQTFGNRVVRDYKQLGGKPVYYVPGYRIGTLFWK